MIGKIRRVKSFGSYVDFDWPAELCEFRRFNVFYGWNYSGKTMLSRIFRCFENRAFHPDFPSAEGQLICADNTACVLGSAEGLLQIRVFNSDFIRENLKFDEGSAAAVLVLGAEDIAKQDELKEKRKRRGEIDQSLEDAKRKRILGESSLDKALSSKARDAIKNQFGVPNYDKTRFEPRVLECMDAPEAALLSEESVSNYSAQFLSKDKKGRLSKVTAALASLDALRESASAALARSVTSHRLPRLASSPDAERWVDSGRPLHERVETCFFCGQQLPPGLLDTLKGHFSEEYDRLMEELSKLSVEISRAMGEQINLPHPTEFYPEQASLFEGESRETKLLEEDRRSVLKKLADAVDEKKMKAFTELECPEVIDPRGLIAKCVENINSLIEEHNKRTDEFEQGRQNAFNKLEMHFAASFVIEQDYATRKLENEEIRDEIEKNDLELSRLDGEISALEAQLSEAAAGAARINEILKAYFGKEDLKVQVSPDKRFRISRGGVIAKNLSEGEKTAVAFSYFITRLQDGRHALDDTIVVIDDPISSLDANHLFNTYALIKTQIGACKQLFLSTHSFEFFNLLKEWATDQEKHNRLQDFAKWRDWRFYLVRRGDTGESRIENIPPVLMHFKSEYHYLFGELYRFSTNASGDFDRLYTLPNLARRFMEAFGGIMIPKSQGLVGKMDRLFADVVERERVWKFINHYSHQTSVMRSLTIPDIAECKAVVDACLNAVREWDGDYFRDLESEIS